MFVNVQNVPSLVDCQIKAWGSAYTPNDSRFSVLTQEDFIRQKMSEAGRRELLGPMDHDSAEAIAATARKWSTQTGIEKRIFFDGSTSELAAIAAKDCLEKAVVSPAQLDLIIGGTNTGPGYPSLADHVKLSLGDESARAACWDLAEACPVGAAAIFNGWAMIRSGACQRVLVVCAEKATTLTNADNWRGANLFGDGAFAVLLVAGDGDSFVFFEGDCLPFDGNLGKVVKDETTGFFQDGLAVHKFVGNVASAHLIKAVAEAGIDPADIKHLVPHQPSGKTLDLLLRKLQKAWPELRREQMQQNVSFTGNTSGASTGSIISHKIDEGVIKPGELVVVTTFGSGVAIFNYGFRM